MDAAGADDIAVVASNIDSFSQAACRVAHLSAIAMEIKVASLAGFDRDRLWKTAVLCLQRPQARPADFAIDVEDEHASASRNPEVAIRPCLEPALDLFRVGARTMNARRQPRVLPGM